MIKRLLREPLLHFLLIGAALFVVYSFANPQDKSEIVVDAAVVSDLSAKWRAQRKQDPSADELVRLVSGHVAQEVLYREALKRGLASDDAITKRRLAKKMLVISDRKAMESEPSEAMLRAYYTENLARYSKPPVYTLTQVYFDTRKPGAQEAAEAALQTDNPEAAGDPISLPKRYVDTPATKLRSDFGANFPKALTSLPLRVWSGPVKSKKGIHLVKIEAKSDLDALPFEKAQDRVAVDYGFEVNEIFRQAMIQDLLKNYEVTISVPDAELTKVLNSQY